MPEYFEKWFSAKNQAILPMSAAEAKSRHEKTLPYVVTLDIDNGKRVVDIAGDWVSAMFFDEHDRNFLRYDFKKIEPSKLFLSSALHLEYSQKEKRPSRSITFAFKPDGSIFIERRDLFSGEVEEKDSSSDPRPNWEAYPNFGEYAAVCRLDRK